MNKEGKTMSQTLPKPTMTLMEAVDAIRDDFKKEYGDLLTEEEAVQWVDEIREDLRLRGEL